MAKEQNKRPEVQRVPVTNACCTSKYQMLGVISEDRGNGIVGKARLKGKRDQVALKLHDTEDWDDHEKVRVVMPRTLRHMLSVIAPGLEAFAMPQ